MTDRFIGHYKRRVRQPFFLLLALRPLHTGLKLTKPQVIYTWKNNSALCGIEHIPPAGLFLSAVFLYLPLRLQPISIGMTVLVTVLFIQFIGALGDPFL